MASLKQSNWVKLSLDALYGATQKHHHFRIRRNKLRNHWNSDGFSGQFYARQNCDHNWSESCWIGCSLSALMYPEIRQYDKIGTRKAKRKPLTMVFGLATSGPYPEKVKCKQKKSWVQFKNSTSKRLLFINLLIALDTNDRNLLLICRVFSTHFC